MTKIVVDTDILIDYLRTGKGLLPTLLKLQMQGKVEIYLSSMSVFELFAGKSSRETSLKLLELIAFFKIIPVTLEIAKLAGELKRDNNLSIAVADLIIGVCALYIRAKIATRNLQHFQGIPKLKFYR